MDMLIAVYRIYPKVYGKSKERQGGFFPPFCLVVSVVLRMHRQSGQLLGVPEDSVVAFCKLLNGAPKKADTTSCTESMLECMRYWRYADSFWRNMLNAFGSK